MLRDVHVLVVDDQADTRDSVLAILEHAGAAVSAAGSAREALPHLNRALPDVIVSDVAMPGEDGYELVRKIRNRTPEGGGRVPTLALTAHATMHHQRRVRPRDIRPTSPGGSPGPEPHPSGFARRPDVSASVVPGSTAAANR